MQIATVAERLAIVKNDFPDLSQEDQMIVAGLSKKKFQAWHFLAQNLNTPICRPCLNENLRNIHSDASDQLAANIRDLRVEGFDIPKNQKIECKKHGKKTADQLRSLTPVEGESRLRFPYSPAERKKMLGYFGREDAFDFDKTHSVELDHRIPMSRASEDEERIDPDDETEVRKVFMPLTGTHNLQKDRACQSCISTNRRPPFLGIKFWSQGNENYDEALGCNGCGWAYPEEWREALQKELN